MRIRTLTLLLLLISSTIPLLIFHFVILNQEKEYILASNISRLEDIADIQHRRIKAMLVNTNNAASLIKSRTQLRKLLGDPANNESIESIEKISLILKHAIGAVPDVRHIGLFKPDLTLLYSTNEELTQELIKTDFIGGPADYNVKFLKVLDESFIVFLEEVNLDSELIGYMAIAFSKAQLSAIVSDYTGLEKTGEIVLAAKNQMGDATLLTPTRHEPSVELSLTISKEDTEIPITNAIKGSNEVFHESLDYRGIPVLAVSHHIPETDWGMVVKIDRNEVFQKLNEFNFQSLKVLLVTLFIIFVFSFFIVGRITKPFSAMQKALSETARGKKKEIKDSSAIFEVSAVLKSFNYMIRQLKQSDNTLRSSIRELTELNTKLDWEAERFKRWKESNFIGIIHSDANGHILDANSTMLDMIGYTQEELESNLIDWKKLTPERYLPLDTKAVEEANEKGYWTPFEKAYVHKNGFEVPILIGGSIFKESSQEFIVFVVNLSEKYQKIRELEEYRGIIENSHDIFAFVDRNYTYKTVNQAYLNLHNLERHDVIGHTVYEILGEEFFYSKLKQRIDRVLQGELVSFVERTFFPKANKNRTLKISYIPYHSENGDIIGFIFKGEDITELEAKQKTIEHKEAEQKHIIESMLEGVFTIDSKGIILSFNPEAEKIYGYEAKEIIGKSLDLLIDGDLDHKSLLQSYLKSGKSNVIDNRIGRELLAKHKNGHLFPIRIAVASMPINELGEAHFIANFQDLSEYERQRELLNRSSKLESLGNVAGGIAHDFNNILGIILGYANLLSENKKVVKSSYIQSIEGACERGQKLTKNLLTFAKKTNQEAKNIDVNELINKNVELIQTVLTSKIRLCIELTKEECIVRIESNLFEDMLLNMSINSMHAMPEGGDLNISTSRVSLGDVEAKALELKQGKYVKIAISDTGKGIAKEDVDKIFDPFFTTKEEFGSGLGLSQCYGFIKSSAGSVNVHSLLGEGTSFDVYLPCAKDFDFSEKKVEKIYQFSVSNKINKILVIDDEPELRLLLKAFLENEPIVVFEAEDADKALEIVKHEEIDFVITDIIMPNISGLDLVKKINKVKEGIPHLFITGFTNSVSKSQLDKMENILFKPFTKNDLLQKVNSICESHNRAPLSF